MVKNMVKERKKTYHGGYRKNAGRKMTGETVETVVIRVPKAIEEDIRLLIKSYKKSNEYQEKIEKFKVKIGQKIVISLSFWKDKKETYKNYYLLRKVTKVRETYFETEGSWRFGRINTKKGIISRCDCKEYRNLKKTYGVPEIVSARNYISRYDKKLKFL
jgi:hypothetical protein